MDDIEANSRADHQSAIDQDRHKRGQVRTGKEHSTVEAIAAERLTKDQGEDVLESTKQEAARKKMWINEQMETLQEKDRTQVKQYKAQGYSDSDIIEMMSSLL